MVLLAITMLVDNGCVDAAFGYVWQDDDDNNMLLFALVLHVLYIVIFVQWVAYITHVMLFATR